MSELVLGIDVGTASTKAVLADVEGQIVGRSERAHRLNLPRVNWAEHDADDAWWGGLLSACRELVGDSAPKIAAVAVSGVGPCLLPCDRDLRPLRPAILYGIDARATAEIEELNRRYGIEEILAHAGSPLTSQAIGPKLLWLQRHEPEVWRRTAGWYTASSFLVAKLTGEYILDHHTASQCDPLYDMHSSTWSDAWAGGLTSGVPLPRLAWPADVVGYVTAGAASETGLAAGTPVLAGTVDAWAEAFSVGVRKPGDVMLMYGSTMFIVHVVRNIVPQPGLWSTMGVEQGVVTYAAGMSTSGSLTSWLRELVSIDDFGQLAAEAAAVPAGARALLMLPYFAGERSPLFDPDARGTIIGLTLAHSRAELARAVYEGTAFAVRHNLESMKEAAGPPARVVAVGGGTKADIWPQIVSSVTGVAQQIPRQTIGAAYGDALLAAIGSGLVPPEADWTEIQDRVDPEPRDLEVYGRLYPLYRELQEFAVPFSHKLLSAQPASEEGQERKPGRTLLRRPADPPLPNSRFKSVSTLRAH